MDGEVAVSKLLYIPRLTREQAMGRSSSRQGMEGRSGSQFAVTVGNDEMSLRNMYNSTWNASVVESTWDMGEQKRWWARTECYFGNMSP